MDTTVDYLNATKVPIAARLTHTTNWSVDRLTPASRDPNTWNPDKISSIRFNVPVSVKVNHRRAVVFAAPNEISDQAYFQSVSTDYCLENYSTPSTGTTNP